MARKQSTTTEVATWVEDLPAAFLACRDMGHAWRPYAASWVASEKRYQRTLRCGRCHTERVQMLSTSGHVESGWYRYPDGYAMPHGAGGYDVAARDACHLASLLRLVEETRAS